MPKKLNPQRRYQLRKMREGKCPQCGIRPAEVKLFAVTKRKRRTTRCTFCRTLDEARRKAREAIMATQALNK